MNALAAAALVSVPGAGPGVTTSPSSISRTRTSWISPTKAILAANQRPSPRHGTVPPEAEIVLDQLAAYGTSDQIRRQLMSWDQAADIVTILLPPGMSWPDIEATLLAAAPGAAPAIVPDGLAAAGEPGPVR